jgi:carbon monoxide dehydrogenase subunit G
MASIIMDVSVQAPAETVWNALSNFGEAHRVFAGVLSDCRLEADDMRIVTFASGLVARERIISIDATRGRIAYTVVGGGFEHHGASMQVVAEDDGTCRFVWACDVLPNAAADRIRPLMDAGVAALKRTFEQG